MAVEIILKHCTSRAKKTANTLVATCADFGLRCTYADDDEFLLEQNTDSFNAFHIRVRFRSSIQTENELRDHLSISLFTRKTDEIVETNAVLSIYNRISARIVGNLFCQFKLFPAGVPEKQQPGYGLFN